MAIISDLINFLVSFIEDIYSFVQFIINFLSIIPRILSSLPSPCGSMIISVFTISFVVICYKAFKL